MSRCQFHYINRPFIYIFRLQNKIKFRQLTNGKHLIQLIYVNETIKDCDIVNQRDQVLSFLTQFRYDLSQLVTTSNVTVDSLDNKTLPEDIDRWLDYALLRNSCKRSHIELKKALNTTKKKEKEFELKKLRFVFN